MGTEEALPGLSKEAWEILRKRSPEVATRLTRLAEEGERLSRTAQAKEVEPVASVRKSGEPKPIGPPRSKVESKQRSRTDWDLGQEHGRRHVSRNWTGEIDYIGGHNDIAGYRSFQRDLPAPAPAPAPAPGHSFQKSPLERLYDEFSAQSKKQHVSYWIQVGLILTTAAGLMGLMGWAAVLVNREAYTQGAIFGAGGVGTTVFAKRWEPLRKLRETERLCHEMNLINAGIALRLETISKIADPKERNEAQAKAIAEALNMTQRPGNV